LDCSIDKFIKNGIPEEDAKILLKHLYHCIGNLNFKFILKTDNVSHEKHIFSTSTGRRTQAIMTTRFYYDET